MWTEVHRTTEAILQAMQKVPEGPADGAGGRAREEQLPKRRKTRPGAPSGGSAAPPPGKQAPLPQTLPSCLPPPTRPPRSVPYERGRVDWQAVRHPRLRANRWWVFVSSNVGEGTLSAQLWALVAPNCSAQTAQPSQTAPGTVLAGRRVEDPDRACARGVPLPLPGPSPCPSPCNAHRCPLRPLKRGGNHSSRK